MLLSGAVDRALDTYSLAALSGRKVFVEFGNLKAYDQEYVKTAMRARLVELGAVLVDRIDQADYVAELASGAVGMEYKTVVVGLPSFPIPNAPIPTPELSIYKSVEQTGIAKLLILVLEKGRLVDAARCFAKADRREYFFIGMRYGSVDDVREDWRRAEAKRAAAKPSSNP